METVQNVLHRMMSVGHFLVYKLVTFVFWIYRLHNYDVDSKCKCRLSGVTLI